MAILQLPFCHLEEISLTYRQAVNWGGFSGELKDALSALIHLPTLKILYLEKIDNVPITLFLGIVHLTKLHLRSVSLNYSGGEQPSSLTMKGVATTTSHTVIDKCLWSFSKPTRGRRFPKYAYFSLIRVLGDIDYPTAATIFLPFMSHLRVLEIYISPFSTRMSDFAVLSFLMRSLCASLTAPATLEHLKLVIVFEGNDNFFNHYKFYRDLRRDNVWRYLDSIVTHPTGSRLQRVDIDITYCFRYDDDVMEPDNDEILEAVLDALPLLRDKGILFVGAEEA